MKYLVYINGYATITDVITIENNVMEVESAKKRIKKEYFLKNNEEYKGCFTLTAIDYSK